jgi:hypothetical protein
MTFLTEGLLVELGIYRHLPPSTQEFVPDAFEVRQVMGTYFLLSGWRQMQKP